MPALTYPEAIVVGLFQGVSELFPVSSLGHSVLIPALIGGRWARDLNVSAPESPYLAFIVGLHVATALALLAYFWRDWLRIAGGFATSLRDRQVRTADQRLAWLIILATIPVGIAGLLLEHTFRTVLGKPIPAAIFLTVNGVILYAGERLRRRDPAQPAPAGHARQMATASASQPAAQLASEQPPQGRGSPAQAAANQSMNRLTPV
jgi:undecaprenyl-diphosphatase